MQYLKGWKPRSQRVLAAKGGFTQFGVIGSVF